MNGLDIIASAEDGDTLIREHVAKGMTVEDIATWLEVRSRSIF